MSGHWIPKILPGFHFQEIERLAPPGGDLSHLFEVLPWNRWDKSLTKCHLPPALAKQPSSATQKFSTKSDVAGRNPPSSLSHLMNCDVLNSLDSLCRENAAPAQFFDLAFGVEALGIKALLIWSQAGFGADLDDMQKSPLLILPACPWKGDSEVIKHNKIITLSNPPGSRIPFDVLTAVLKTARNVAGGWFHCKGNKMPHVGSNWDPSLAHQEGTEKPKPCCLIYNSHFDILQLWGESEKCLSRMSNGKRQISYNFVFYYFVFQYRHLL